MFLCKCSHFLDAVQTTDTNLELPSTFAIFAGKFFWGAGGAPKIKINMHNSDWLDKAFTLSLIGYTSTREQLSAILIGFFHIEYKAKIFLQMSLME